tara:strand:+ start:248 stop:1360 length:1113 start_codon:yes stop_codon:yes gene_type:complete
VKKISFFFLFLSILLISSFLVLEISLRVYLSAKHFKNPHISYLGKTWYSYEQENLKIAKFDKNLLSDLKKSNIQNINLPRWNPNSNIIIDKFGFRYNANEIENFKNNKKILVTGDSFAFGSQVSNNQSWPSYLEKLIKVKVFNGGHPGYGTGQSLRKAILISTKDKFDYFIWSFIYQDFDRDQSSKILIKKNNILQFNQYKKKPNYVKKNYKKNIYHTFKEIFFLVYLVDREIIKKIDIFNDNKGSEKYYTTLLNASDQYTSTYSVEEQITFLIDKFKEIEIENKFILIQHTDLSKNTNEETINKRIKIYDEKYKYILFEVAKKNGIKIVDTEEAFKNMSEEEKRLMWFDHHTSKGNRIVAEYIAKNINF